MKSSKDPFVHIADDWYFTGDKFCLSLYRRRITKKGKVQYDCEGYYTDYREMHRALVKKEVFPLTNLEDIIKCFDHVEKLIEKLHQRMMRHIKSSQTCPCVQENKKDAQNAARLKWG